MNIKLLNYIGLDFLYNPGTVYLWACHVHFWEKSKNPPKTCRIYPFWRFILIFQRNPLQKMFVTPNSIEKYGSAICCTHSHPLIFLAYFVPNKLFLLFCRKRKIMQSWSFQISNNKFIFNIASNPFYFKIIYNIS